jgi:hypothetical protein
MGVGDRPGINRTPNLGMNVGSSRGFMDNKTAGENTGILDGIAGAMRVKRYLLAYNPAALVDDTWTFVPMPDPELTALGGTPSSDFGQMIRCSNVFKVLCARFRSIMSGGGGQVLDVQLKKNDMVTPVEADPDCLINPVQFVNDEVNIQNLSGFALGVPQAPVIGKDSDALGLWLRKQAGWAAPISVTLEIIVTLQMLPELPPVVIIDPT